MDVSPWYLNKSKVRDEGTLQSFPFMPSAFKSNIMPIKNRRSQVLRYGRIVFSHDRGGSLPNRDS
jgi:hypothetical protein